MRIRNVYVLGPCLLFCVSMHDVWLLWISYKPAFCSPSCPQPDSLILSRLHVPSSLAKQLASAMLPDRR